jgi:hypothetical protein
MSDAVQTPTPVQHYVINQDLLIEVLNHLAKEPTVALTLKLNQLPKVNILPETAPVNPVAAPTPQV